MAASLDPLRLKLEKNENEQEESSPWTTVDAELLVEILLLVSFLNILGFVRSCFFLAVLSNGIITFEERIRELTSG